MFGLAKFVGTFVVHRRAVAVHAFGVLGSGLRHVLLTVVAVGTRAQLDDAYVIRRDVVAILASHLSLAGDGEHLALGALVALSPHRSLNVHVRCLHDGWRISK